MTQGEFTNLPGAGKPLDLEEYFSTPEELRMAFSILKNANCFPAEVELLRELARLDETLKQTSDDATRREVQRTILNRRTELAMMLERRGGKP